MPCNCRNIIPQSKECYDNMINIEIPDHMKKYRENRIKAGFSGYVSIDPCIFVEIWQLWKKGIITYGCCCGHNSKNPSFVNVDEANIKQMLDMGYVPNHQDLTRMDTFELKSVSDKEVEICVNCDQEKETHAICDECLTKIINENKQK